MTNGKISFQYPKMVAPFPVKPFDQMTKKEAKQYFDWYVGQMDVRIALLKRVYSETGGEGELNLTPESLTPLWNWFVGQVKGRRLTDQELEEERKQAHLVAAVARQKGAQVSEAQVRAAEQYFIQQAREMGIILSEETESLCVDIAFYIVKILMNKFPTMHWRVGSGKRYIYYNQPVVALFPGRSYDFKPSVGIRGAAENILRGTNSKNIFYEIFRRTSEEFGRGVR
jgi:hypothetical protein